MFFPPTINAHLESESEITHSCPTLCDPMGCSLPGFSVHAIFQARVLEWVAISFSWGSSQPKDRTQACCIAGRPFTVWATREVRQPRQHIKKQRHYFANKGPSSQGYGFSSDHVWTWELDYKTKLSAEELMLLKCGVGEDSWESLGLQGDPTSPS